MTSTLADPERLRRVLVPAPEESVPRLPRRTGPRTGPQPRPRPATTAPTAGPDPHPPLYRALLARWTDEGRALPGTPDPEWERLAAPLVRPGQFGGTAAGPFRHG
ncbi:hypothetical protein JNUCC64_29695 [Streptomyces sp. JNUCC 64]